MPRGLGETLLAFGSRSIYFTPSVVCKRQLFCFSNPFKQITTEEKHCEIPNPVILSHHWRCEITSFRIFLFALKIIIYCSECIIFFYICRLMLISYLASWFNNRSKDNFPFDRLQTIQPTNQPLRELLKSAEIYVVFCYTLFVIWWNFDKVTKYGRLHRNSFARYGGGNILISGKSLLF